MSGVHFTPLQEQWLREHYNTAPSYDVLTDHFNAVFHTRRTKNAVQEKCSKRLGLKGMPNPTCYGSKQKEELPVGTVRKTQTATYVKVQMTGGNKRIKGYQKPYWIPLQEKIWRDAGRELPEGYMVCHLDGDTENFDLDNLCAINHRTAARLAVNGWWSEDREITRTGVMWCELQEAINQRRNENG